MGERKLKSINSRKLVKELKKLIKKNVKLLELSKVDKKRLNITFDI